jgi:uncharacterized membrane protein
MRLSTLTYALILAAVLLWCGGILLAPLCVAEGGSAAPLGRAFYQVYHGICHQTPDRSFHLLGHPLGVCVRCSSIYFAFLAGTILFPFLPAFFRRTASSRAVLAAALLPMLVDATWIGSGLYHTSTLTRMITGGVFGLLVSLVLLPLALQAVHELRSTAHQQKGFTDA